MCCMIRSIRKKGTRDTRNEKEVVTLFFAFPASAAHQLAAQAERNDLIYRLKYQAMAPSENRLNN